MTQTQPFSLEQKVQAQAIGMLFNPGIEVSLVELKETQPKPKYTIGQKVNLQITFNATAVVMHAPEWDSVSGYSYELTDIEVSEDILTSNICFNACLINVDASYSSFSEADLQDGEILESLPSCEFESN